MTFGAGLVFGAFIAIVYLLGKAVKGGDRREAARVAVLVVAGFVLCYFWSEFKDSLPELQSWFQDLPSEIKSRL